MVQGLVTGKIYIKNIANYSSIVTKNSALCWSAALQNNYMNEIYNVLIVLPGSDGFLN